MPKTEINYNNTIIYKIVCNNLAITSCYVGHTTNFIKRKCCHKHSCNNENDKGYNLLVYKTIRENGDWNNWSMIEVEKYICNDLNEAKARERYWIEELKADLNKQLPTRTKKEWIEDNKEHIKNYQKEWKQDNKNILKEYQKDYREQNKEYQKDYREKNKEYQKQYQKEYRENKKLNESLANDLEK